MTPASVLFAHTYDASNRRSAQSTTDDAWWSLPTTGQITDYAANNLNQYTSIEPILPSGSTVTPSYDSNGNLADDDSLTYAYDRENRLTQIDDSGGTVATYAYDARGRRKTKAVGSATTVFVTDAEDREVLEYDGSTGAPIAWYAFGLGPDTVLNRMDHSGSTRSTLIPDIQGSIVGELDATTASLTTGGYEPYGSNTADTSAGFRYTARRLDSETSGSTSQPSGLYYYRARMYSPAWGRFLQPDPIGYEGGRNLYAYVENDPLNAVDPNGLILDALNPISEASATEFQSRSGSITAIPDLDAIYELSREVFRNPEPVGSAVGNLSDPYVAAAASPLIRQQAIETGEVFLIESLSYPLGAFLLQAEGTAPDKDTGLPVKGIYEYIVPINQDLLSGAPILTHQRFIKDAPISGYANNFGGRFYPPFDPGTGPL